MCAFFDIRTVERKCRIGPGLGRDSINKVGWQLTCRKYKATGHERLGIIG